jgi:hypothetical protein
MAGPFIRPRVSEAVELGTIRTAAARVASRFAGIGDKFAAAPSG